MREQEIMYYSFDNGWFFLQAIIVIFMIGWLIARVQQNGYSITYRSEQQFFSDFFISSILVGGGSFFLCLLIAVIDMSGFIAVFQIFGGILLLAAIAILVITICMATMNFAENNISIFMRKYNEGKADKKYSE